MKAWLAALAALLLLALPETGQACAVCFSGRSDESRAAFLLTTVLLTSAPLALIGAALLWLRRRMRALDAAAARDAGGAPAGLVRGGGEGSRAA